MNIRQESGNVAEIKELNKLSIYWVEDFNKTLYEWPNKKRLIFTKRLEVK